MTGHRSPVFLYGCICISLAFLPHGRHPGGAACQEQAGQSRLAAILIRSGEYCQRLSNAALDFICLEEVTEMTRHYTPQTDVYLYDYQFVRKDQETREKRNLIAFNGKKANIPDSPLSSFMFQYKNVLFGPVGLLSKAWQSYHDFRIVGEDTINQEKAVVVEATPKHSFISPHCYGRIWIKEEDGSVLKVVWDQRSLGNFQRAEEWAKIHEAKPQITAYSEYGFEKNGLRFPSRSYTENAFIEKNKRKFVSGEISILYKEYKFFTVETEIKYGLTGY